MRAQFCFATCRPGAEPALVQEVALARPTWRPAFRRPGFLTFKLPEPHEALAAWLAAPVFAHRWGGSLGRFADLAAALAEARQLAWPRPPRLSAWVRPERDSDEAVEAAFAAARECGAELER